MSIPKNYITAGISKNLLTPCRRVGLSRSKKTPNNFYASPLTAVANSSTVKTTPNKNEESPKVDKKNADYSETRTPSETPKALATLKQAKRKTTKKVAVDNISKNIKDKCPEVPEQQLESCKVFINLDERATTNIERKNTLENSPKQSIPTKTLVAAEIHHPVVKKSINFNTVNEPSHILNKYEKMLKPRNNNSAIDSSVSQKDTLCLYQLEEKLKENTSKASVKRKLRLDSDDSINSEKQEHQDSAKARTFSKSKIVENNLTLKEGSNTVLLSRFTTEDYLKEYSSNPEIFQENMEIRDGSEVALLQENANMEIFSSLSNDNRTIMKIKSDLLHTTEKACLNKKNYVAKLCPTDQSSTNDKKSKRCLSTKKFSHQMQSQSDKIQVKKPFKHKLTINLQRLTKNDISNRLKSNGKNDDQLEELPSTPEHLIAKKSLPITNFDEDDEEFFTSSPENDKKQRENLLQLILTTENEIKHKQEKLDKLKQAQVYKKKHSPEKLKISSDRWLEGCKAGLNDLLVKMQEHCPMEMDVLTKKLGIPDNIVGKLKF